MRKTFLRLLGSTMTAAVLAGTLGQFPVRAAVENGWEEVDGKRYWYENGVKQGAEGRGKEIYDPGSDAWYWLDAVDEGKMAVSKDVYQESQADEAGNIGKWVRYDGEGHMIKGWSTTEAGTYYFDLTYGTMAKGSREIDGVSYFFNEETGILESGGTQDGWVTIDGKEYWYEGGVRQGYDPNDLAYRGKEIYDPGSDAWYWLDNVQQGVKAVSKDVYQESQAGPWAENSDGTGKWVRYDSNGHMVKGWETTENGTYYFDPTYGTMAKGRVEIGGKEYNFDQATGIQMKEADPTDTPDGAVEWNLTDGKLTVSGRIVGEDISAGKAPWHERREEITSVVMKGTGVGSFENLFGSFRDDNAGGYFPGYPNVHTIDLSGLDTSAVTDMSSMFNRCKHLSSIDLSGLDTSAVTDMSSMFWKCGNLASIELSTFDTSAVTDMSGMFGDCWRLESLDLSGFDTSAVTSMSSMFTGCNGLKSLDLSSFDTSAVTDMEWMFNCCGMTSLDLSSFDTSAVTDMGYMFSYCDNLESLDLRSFDTSAVRSMFEMFMECKNLKEILVDGNKWNIGSNTNTKWMFSNCGVSEVTIM